MGGGEKDNNNNNLIYIVLICHLSIGKRLQGTEKESDNVVII